MEAIRMVYLIGAFSVGESITQNTATRIEKKSRPEIRNIGLSITRRTRNG
jgi:hypothetical protein